MPAYPESASNNSPQGKHRQHKILVCGVNWIGDSIMSMPALQAFRRAHLSDQIDLLVKSSVAPLWKIHRTPDHLHVLHEGLAGTLRTAWSLKSRRYEKAYILPRSFRSALVPFLAGIPERIGMPGHSRDFLLTGTVIPILQPGRTHQAYEYMDLLFGPGKMHDLPHPEIALNARDLKKARVLVSATARPLIGLMPGAARGPSKRWPAGHFAQTARRLIQDHGYDAVVLGGKAEADICRETVKAIGGKALNVAGLTTLPESMALLSLLSLLIANDSGGMHMAAAVGTPVVAVYGATDPGITGPLGSHHRIVQSDGAKSRDIKRNSAAAQKALEAITPEQVCGEALKALAGDFQSP
ncbi:MAG: lipopolysaccharide heptosyltransferase II [Lentisphaerota bacterium]